MKTIRKVGVRLTNESAAAVLRAAFGSAAGNVCSYREAQISTAPGRPITISFIVDEAGNCMPHCIVLDERGMWHLRSEVDA